MSLSQISLLFLLQMGLGSLITFLVNDRRALGAKYFKFGGWVLAALFGLAGSLVWPAAFGSGSEASALGPTGDARPLALCVAAAVVGVVAFASVSGWDRPLLERLSLGTSILAAAAAVTLATLRPAAGFGWTDGERALVLAASAGSTLVLGFTTWGMILGHWYLVDHGLDIRHLARLVRPLPWILLAKAALSGLVLWTLWDRVLGPGNQSLADVMTRNPDRVLDVANVWARIPVGLVIPAVLAFMTLVTVRMRKTQPATGILYAMCVLVYMGELMGRMLAGSTGVPL